jgi:hypothetical protein
VQLPKKSKAISLRLGEYDAPDELDEPIKHRPAPAQVEAPAPFLDVSVDGRGSAYFEWMGADFMGSWT